MTKCDIGRKGFSIFQVTLEGKQGTQTVSWSRNWSNAAHKFACCGSQLLATVSWCKAADMRSSLASGSTHRIQWRPSQDCMRALQLGFPTVEPHILNLCYQMIEKPSDYSHHPIVKWWPCCPLTSCKAKTPPTKEAPLELSLCAKPKGLLPGRKGLLWAGMLQGSGCLMTNQTIPLGVPLLLSALIAVLALGNIRTYTLQFQLSSNKTSISLRPLLILWDSFSSRFSVVALSSLVY